MSTGFTVKRAIFFFSSLFFVWLVDWGFSHFPFAEPLLSGDLSALQAKQVDIYVQATQQMLTFATFVLAGVGLFITPEREKTAIRPLWPLLPVAILSAFSIYLGFLSLNATVWMLSKQFFNLQTPILHYLRLAQFWSFAVSVLLFAWFWFTHSTLEESK